MFPNFLWKDIKLKTNQRRDYKFTEIELGHRPSSTRIIRRRARFYSLPPTFKETDKSVTDTKLDLINNHFLKKHETTRQQLVNLRTSLKNLRGKPVEYYKDLYNKAKVRNFNKVPRKKLNNFSYLMKIFLEKLNIFNLEGKKSEDMFNKNIRQPREETFIDCNKKLVANVYKQINKKVEQVLPSLADISIDSLRKKYPDIKDTEVYEFYALYKSILKLSICLSQNIDTATKGVDFDAFLNGVPQIIGESRALGKKIFNSINTNGDSYLSLHEFLSGISQIKSNSLMDKIDLFFKVKG